MKKCGESSKGCQSGGGYYEAVVLACKHYQVLVLGRSSIIIDNQSFTSLILINRLQNWQSIII